MGTPSVIDSTKNRIPQTYSRKFSLSPETGQFWSGHDIETAQSIKGTYFPDIKTIYLFDSTSDDVLEKAKTILQETGLPKDHQIIWGPLAAAELSLFFSGL